MKKITRSSELLWLFGIIFVALGVAICSKTNLGVSMIAAPAFVLSEAPRGAIPFFSVGVMEYIFQGALLTLMCVCIKKFNWKYLFAFAVAVIYGYTLNLFIFLLKDVCFDGLILRWVMLIVGDTITAFGVACFFKTYMPLQVYELFVAEFSKHFKININKIKWSFDLTLLVISIVLTLTLFDDIGSVTWKTFATSSFHNIGLGTLVTTAINSPIINIMGKIINKIFGSDPLIPKLEEFFKR